MDNRVVIRYAVDVTATPFQPAHLAGETFTVTDAVAAAQVHPDAEVIGYADLRPFVASADPSLLAVAEAEEAARIKAEEKAAAKADAEKAEAEKAKKGA